jgi:hypothetical protein
MKWDIENIVKLPSLDPFCIVGWLVEEQAQSLLVFCRASYIELRK